MTGVWQELILDDAAYVGAGNPAPQNKALFEEGKHPFFRTADVGKVRFGELSTSVDLLNDVGVASLRLVPKGTILMPKSGASTFLNHRAITQVDGYVSSHLATITAKKGIAEPRYLLYALGRVNAQDLLPENAYPSLNLATIRNIPISLPPLEEQRRIVAILDDAFERLDCAHTHTEKNLRDAQELFAEWGANALQSISDRRPVPTVSVKDIALPQKGSIRTGPFGSQLLHGEFVNEGIAVLGIDNAVGNEFRWGKRRFITPEKYHKLSRFTVQPGDVIITIMGTCGRCAVIPEDIPTAINTKHLCCISLDRKKCLPEYLHRYFLLSRRARSYLSAEASGSVMDGLNMGIIKEMPVELPCIDEQRELVSRIVDIESRAKHVAANYRAQKNRLNELRQSILRRAFAGKLT